MKKSTSRINPPRNYGNVSDNGTYVYPPARVTSTALFRSPPPSALKASPQPGFAYLFVPIPTENTTLQAVTTCGSNNPRSRLNLRPPTRRSLGRGAASGGNEDDNQCLERPKAKPGTRRMASTVNLHVAMGLEDYAELIREPGGWHQRKRQQAPARKLFYRTGIENTQKVYARAYDTPNGPSTSYSTRSALTMRYAFSNANTSTVPSTLSQCEVVLSAHVWAATRKYALNSAQAFFGFAATVGPIAAVTSNPPLIADAHELCRSLMSIGSEHKYVDHRWGLRTRISSAVRHHS
ncbi:hypothetical protein DFH08DRAFT_804071 [Mycena albidolilacea]|uniref:Uncharacterized protein n=1 Tax=Mycena albidolilacea TaxID=1033008 RepID=A0AAD7EVX7_9AGAR|nr:hypothetical protein DFH08DRAFT_804071 [Mycena albidolilacea]